MSYKFVYYPSNCNSSLSIDELDMLIQAFPNLSASNIKKLGPPTGEEYLFSKEGPIPEPCKTYGCNVNTRYYISATQKNGSKKLFKVPDALLCEDSNYKCLEFKFLSLNYNCIGWALGIRKWINPLLKSKFPVKKQNLKDFLEEVDSNYPNNHPQRILGRLDDLDSKNATCPLPHQIETFEHDVTFYFRDDKLTHASRYLGTIEERKVNSWTSKLGDSILISHNLEDLNDHSKNATYGITQCYMGRISTITLPIDLNL